MNAVELGSVYGIRMKGCDKIFYVGQTRQKVRARARAHFRGRTPVTEALRLLGAFEDFDFDVLEIVPLADLNRREAHWIAKLDTLHPKGMNQCGGATYHTHSERARRKMSEKMKAKCAEPEYKAALKRRNKKLWQDPEYRRRQAEGQALAVSTQEHKDKMSALKKEMWADPEMRKRVSAKAKAQWADPEQRKLKTERIREAKGSAEQRERQSRLAKAAFADPAEKALRLRRMHEGRYGSNQVSQAL